MRRVKYGGMNVAEETQMNEEEIVEETPVPEEELVPEKVAEEATEEPA